MERLSVENPVGMRQMSEDLDEMFFLDYWLFDDRLDENEQACPVSSGGNATFLDDDAVVKAPLLVHEADGVEKRRLRRRSWFGSVVELERRDFRCPTNYNACSGLNAPGLCCPADQTCVNIVGGANGNNVGCCPSGQDCSNGISVGGCDTGAGYQSCPSGPGCCIPGFQCQSTGCKSFSLKKRGD